MHFQDAVRADLQTGVVSAIAAIGPVLPRGEAARADAQFGEALTLVYRVLFLLFAESRELVPSLHPAYGPAYALGSLCRDASRDPGGADGLWDGLAAVTRLSRAGCESADLIVRPFNGRLFARASAPSLERHAPARVVTRASRRRDRAIAAALTALGTRPGPGGRESISYADLGVEQLGAVYEHVLDLDPEQVLSATRAVEPARSPAGRAPHGLRRKETGTFYTPEALAAFVVRRTLAPLVRGATTDEILALRVADPAMGSGAFLVAACRYLAHAYENALVNEGRCAETDLDTHERANIRRLIARRCLAGVDANPVAVQLARLSLWLTTLARDKPLTFLDDRLRVGDSIVGTSPDDLWRIPRRRGTRHRPAETPLFEAAGLAAALQAISQPLRQLSEQRDDSIADVRAKERLWSGLTGDRSPVEPWRAACHLWCARWFWPEAATTLPPSPAEIGSAMDAMVRGDRTLGAVQVERWLGIARAAAGDHGFFHWPLEFADVFYDDSGAPRDRPGFDAVIGNPPWEMLRRDHADPRVTDRARERQGRTLAFVRQSGQYRSCDRGHLNLYQPFLERSLSIARRGGRVGLVLPWGFASDEGAAALRARTIDAGAVDAMVGFDNAEGIFPIHRGLRFMALVTSPGSEPREIRARFGVRTKADIDDLPGGGEDADDRDAFPVRLSASLLRQVGGAALRIPDVRRPDDLEWLERVSRAFPRLGDRDGWNVQFGRELNATEDRSSFGPAGMPVIDGKHIGPFSVDCTKTPHRILRTDARGLMPDLRFARARLGYRDVSGAANRLALIAAVIPADVVTTHTLFCLRTPLGVEQQFFLCALFNSSTLNAIVRMLMGGHVTTALVESLPVPLWTATPDQRRVAALGEHLTRTPADAEALAGTARRRGEDVRTGLVPPVPVVPVVPVVCYSSSFVPRYGFAIDLRKCIGCHACTIACKSEHDIPVGVNRCWVKTVEKGVFPQTQRLFLPVLCNQCEDAPCMNICPTSALFRRRDGIVDLNAEWCIGCRACMAACPYDQLFIDPNTKTAEKCNFCANRLENKLEPACVSVCPTECRIFGDLDDPTSEVAQIAQREAFMVRKPEKGTGPKILYLGADEAAIRPEIAVRPFMFREGQVRLRPLGALDPDPEQPGDARVDYDMPHRQAWGFDLVLYLLFKGISTGAMFLSALLWFLGDRSALVGVGGPILSVLFAAATAVVLVIDLERPERFLYILTRPNWSSWLARGAFLITAHSGIASMWVLCYWMGWTTMLSWLAPVAMAAAVAATGYTGLLFAQGLARDLWQGPHATLDLLAQAAAEGSAAMLLAGAALGAEPHTTGTLAMTLGLASLVHLGILLLEHVLTPSATLGHELAVRAIRRGAYARLFWIGAIGFGGLAPIAIVWLASAAAYPANPRRLGRHHRARGRIRVGVCVGGSGTGGAELMRFE